MKYQIYQDKEGNVYNLTTELEQIMIRDIIDLQNKIDNISNYIEKMSYCEIVDNPKKDLVKILKRVDKE